ncbi:MAG: 1,4-dihydroxy-2-naphthoate polyprenyltransferase [Bacteroidota bacterium]|nr:1,4-dihydroxy-2-naphthoate octaprenyltransferase [Odoribacter sp.]MDP3645443.1 1,4-dihydroxy-2-naphthoate polyprenyltransferase [Bacteroidota bacterium]
MASLKSWIKAARLRTLPLAISGILMGAALSIMDDGFNPIVTILAIVTALFIQIFSNFANDYGDSQKGTDNQHRVGPKRTVQSGEISPKQMKNGMIVLIILSLGSGIWLVTEGTKGLQLTTFLLFLAFGIVALIAAFRYTAGSNPYGYAGFGDLAVFLFFGILPVAGTYFLNIHQLNPEIFLPATSIGLFSTGVLNLNNMRDIENDRNSGKNTVVVRMGSTNAKIYHSVLILIGILAAVIFTALNSRSTFQWLFLLSFPLFIGDLIQINKVTRPRNFDPFLKKLSLATLLFTVLFGLGIILI